MAAQPGKAKALVRLIFSKGVHEKDGDRLFTKTRDDGFEVKEGRFRLDMREICFTMRMVEHWNRLPREVVDPLPLLGTLQVRSNEDLEEHDLVEDVPAGCTGVGLDDL